MYKYIITAIIILFVSCTAYSNQKQALESATKKAQSLFEKAIAIYENQPQVINSYTNAEEAKLYLKNTDRLKVMKRALNNSLSVKLIVVDNSYHLGNEKRECDLFGTDAMVKKNKRDVIYICPRSLSISEQALAQVIVHELIHTAESRHEFNECETSWTEHLVMLLSGAGNPYGQQYYNSCGFFHKRNPPAKQKSLSI